MPMIKRRIKTRDGGIPPLIWNEESKQWAEEGTAPRVRNTHVPVWMDIETEQAQLKAAEDLEDLGRSVGIALHWIFVKPAQLAWHLIYHALWLAKIIIVNLGAILMYAWLLFFVGGIIYFYFKLTGG